MAIAGAILVGCCILAGVLWYWLRRIFRTLAGTGAVLEAGLNRAAVNRGDRPISEDVDVRTII